MSFVQIFFLNEKFNKKMSLFKFFLFKEFNYKFYQIIAKHTYIFNKNYLVFLLNKFSIFYLNNFLFFFLKLKYINSKKLNSFLYNSKINYKYKLAPNC